MAARQFHSAWLTENHERRIGKDGIRLRVYQGDDYLGRVEISDGGISIHSGKKGQRLLGNLTWWQFFILIAREGRSASHTTPRFYEK